MTRSLALAAAAALIAGCSFDTSSLKPKTDADCPSDEKACGYRCVPRANPATGCGEPTCDPCPTSLAPHQVAACAPDGTCGAACAWGWGDCDATVAGCETALDGPGNCGACGHSCGQAACTGDWTCAPNNLAFAVGEGRGMAASSTGAVYYADASGDGRVFQVGSTTPVATALGALRWLQAANGVVYALGTTASGDQIWAVIAGAVPSTVASASGIADFAVSGTDVYFTVAGRSDLYSEGLGTPTSGTYQTGSSTLGAVAYWPGDTNVPAGAYVAGDEAGGMLYVFSSSSATTRTVSGFNRGVAEQMVVSATRNGPVAFLVFPSDGSVWASGPSGAPQLVYFGSGLTSQMDVCADGAGVYWSDLDHGEIWELRAADGAMFRLATGVSPWGIAASGGSVYWTDVAAHEVRAVPE